MRRSKRVRSLQKEGCQPGMGAFDHPPMASEPVIALNAPAGDTVLNAAALEVSTAPGEVITLVRMCSLPGQRRGLPGLPPTAGRASTNASKTTESWRLALVTQNITGMPWRSVIRWRLVPSLPRSVGLGPVCGPPGAGHAGSIYTGAAEVQLIGAAQFGQQCHVQAVPCACALPVAQPPPAGHATAKPQFLG